MHKHHAPRRVFQPIQHSHLSSLSFESCVESSHSLAMIVCLDASRFNVTGNTFRHMSREVSLSLGICRSFCQSMLILSQLASRKRVRETDEDFLAGFVSGFKGWNTPPKYAIAELRHFYLLTIHSGPLQSARTRKLQDP
jgi:hypothetical protein